MFRCDLISVSGDPAALIQLPPSVRKAASSCQSYEIEERAAISVPDLTLARSRHEGEAFEQMHVLLIFQKCTMKLWQNGLAVPL